MAYNIASGDIATAYRKTIWGPSWNDSRAHQVCSVKVTAYGTEPLVFGLGTRFMQGTDDNAHQYRWLARRIVIQPGETYELDAITVFYNQQVFVRQISGNGIAYIYALPFYDPTRKVQFIGTTAYNTGAGGQSLFYMTSAMGDYGLFDIMVGNFSGTPTVDVIMGATTTNPSPYDFVVRGAPVTDARPFILRKQMMRITQYMIVRVYGGVCDISMLGLGLKNV